MANEDKKDFNAMLNNNKNMPKIEEVNDDRFVKMYGGNKMLIAPPLFYDKVMKKIPKGKLITSKEIREYLANESNAHYTCPLTAGIFINIVAWASHQRKDDITPYWRTLKTNGELNPKYPGGVESQRKILEEEGFKIIQKGRTNIKLFVDNYEKYLYKL